MTEQDWLQCDDPELMWRYLEPLDCSATTHRKTKLLACGLVRWAWDLLDEQGRRIVESIERYADGCERLQYLRDVFDGYFEKVEEEPNRYRRTATGLWSARHENYLLRFAVSEGRSSLKALDPTFDFHTNHVPQICEAIRDIFGNPFRPIILDVAWRSQAAVELAVSINQNNDFSQLPALADALSDAGCADEVVLGHCRSAQQICHMRGCWVLDAVLGDWYWARRGLR